MNLLILDSAKNRVVDIAQNLEDSIITMKKLNRNEMNPHRYRLSIFIPEHTRVEFEKETIRQEQK